MSGELERLKILLSSLGVGLWSWDIATNSFSWDESMVRLYGMKVEPFSGSNQVWLESIHPEDRDRCAREFSQFFAGHSSWDSRFRIVRPNGDIRHILVKGCVIKSEDGTPLSLNVLHLDVSHAAEAEAETLSSSKKMANLLEAVGVGLWESDIGSGVLKLDDTMYRLYGLQRSECPDGREANHRAILNEDKERVLNGNMERIVAGFTRFDDEFRVMHGDGSIHHLAAKIYVERGQDGAPLKIAGANYDLTELRQIESQLHQMMAAIDSSVIVAHTSLDGLITKVNDKFCEISGYSRAELLGKTHRIVNSGHHSPEFFRELWATIRSGQVWTGEICNRKKDGSLYWVQTVITPLRDIGGRICEYVAMRFDVTMVKEAQAALALRREQLLEAQRVGGVGTFSKDLVKNIDEISEEGKRIFGILPGEDSDFAIRLSRIHPDDRHAFFMAENSTFRKGGLQEGEYRIVRPDGSICFALIRIQSSPDALGQIVLIQGTIQDITQRKVLEQQLAQTEETLRIMLHTVAIGIGMISLKGEILELNPEGLQMFGFESIAAARRAGIQSFFQNPEDGLKLLKTLPENGQIDAAEFLFVRRNGSTFWGTITARTKQREEGGPLVILAMTDLTDRKKVESQLLQSDKMASLGEMAAGMAHEINTPLAIIVGKANRIQRLINSPRCDVSQLAEELAIIHETSMRIAKIVKGLHTFARSGEKDPFFKTSVRDIIDHTLGLCQERIKARGVELRLGEVPELLISCRETQIVQVLLNLINNALYAVQSVQEKWILVDVRLLDTQEMELRVTDSGPGIAEGLAEKIMQPFFTTKPVGLGTGLGLSISRGIAVDHGGTLSLDRSSAHTRFVLVLPLHESHLKKESVA